MNKVALAQNKKSLQSKEKNFAWKDNPDIQKLLDVIASIVADEYIQIAKQNPEVFSNNGGPK